MTADPRLDGAWVKFASLPYMSYYICRVTGLECPKTRHRWQAKWINANGDVADRALPSLLCVGLQGQEYTACWDVAIGELKRR